VSADRDQEVSGTEEFGATGRASEIPYHPGVRFRQGAPSGVGRDQSRPESIEERIELWATPDGSTAGPDHGSLGLSQQRTTGLAGSFDFGKDLLTIIRFSVPETMERYGNSSWEVNQEAPYAGDVFQSYNNGNNDKPTEVAAD